MKTYGNVCRFIVDVDRFQLEESGNVVENRTHDRGRYEDDLQPQPLEWVDDREEPLQGDGEGHQNGAHATNVSETISGIILFRILLWVRIECSIRNGLLLDNNGFLLDKKLIFAQYKMNFCSI